MISVLTCMESFLEMSVFQLVVGFERNQNRVEVVGPLGVEPNALESPGGRGRAQRGVHSGPQRQAVGVVGPFVLRCAAKKALVHSAIMHPRAGRPAAHPSFQGRSRDTSARCPHSGNEGVKIDAVDVAGLLRPVAVQTSLEYVTHARLEDHVRVNFA